MGTSLAEVDDRTGAASLWMVSVEKVGDAAAKAGSAKTRLYLMMVNVLAQRDVLKTGG